MGFKIDRDVLLWYFHGTSYRLNDTVSLLVLRIWQLGYLWVLLVNKIKSPVERKRREAVTRDIHEGRWDREREKGRHSQCRTNFRLLMASMNRVLLLRARTVYTTHPPGNRDVTCPQKLDLSSRSSPWLPPRWWGWLWRLRSPKRTPATVTVEPHRPRWWGTRTAPPLPPPPQRPHPPRPPVQRVSIRSQTLLITKIHISFVTCEDYANCIVSNMQTF